MNPTVGVEQILSEITVLLQPALPKFQEWQRQREQDLRESPVTALAQFFRVIAETVDGQKLKGMKLQSRVHVPNRFFEGPRYSSTGLFVFEWVSSNLLSRHGVYFAEVKENSLLPGVIKGLEECKASANLLLRYTPSVYFVAFSPGGIRIYPAVMLRHATSDKLEDYPSMEFSVFLRLCFSGFFGDQLLDGTREFRAVEMKDEHRAEMVLFVTATDDKPAEVSE